MLQEQRELLAGVMRKSGRTDSNRRHSAWEADVLPLNYARTQRRLPQPILYCGTFLLRRL